MRAIFCQNLKRTLWKNGGGITSQLAISPLNASLDNFDWRISVAEIQFDSDFSKFSGCDRALVVWNGNGIVLGGVSILPLVPTLFSGENDSHATLIDGAVSDLGVIWKRGEFRAEMNVVRDLAQVVTGMGSSVSVAVALLFIARGTLEVNLPQVSRDLTSLSARDALLLESPEHEGALLASARLSSDFIGTTISIVRV